MLCLHLCVLACALTVHHSLPFLSAMLCFISLPSPIIAAHASLQVLRRLVIPANGLRRSRIVVPTEGSLLLNHIRLQHRLINVLITVLLR